MKCVKVATKLERRRLLASVSRYCPTPTLLRRRLYWHSLSSYAVGCASIAYPPMLSVVLAQPDLQRLVPYCHSLARYDLCRTDIAYRA
eukprot:827876-Rhodomonas_salina.3